MKVYFYEELRKMSIDELLDLLSTYVYLKKDIWELIKNEKDKDSKTYYIQQNLYFYELNITKIKNELEVQSELKQDIMV